jgi:membrane protein DedA with SNARE-associated domain
MIATMLRAELDLSVVIPLAILGAIVGGIRHYLYSRRWKNHNTDLLSQGFPADLADKVARLLADKRFDEATALLKKHTPKRPRE